MTAELTAAFLMGLVSAGHCLGMCGGITLALGLQNARLTFLLSYNLGRISTYGVLGFIIGAGLVWLPAGFMPVLRLLAAALLMLVALYYLQINRWITQLERLAVPIWHRLEPMARRWLPIKTYPQAYATGVVWGLLPCGLIYSALGFAATQAQPLASSAVMLAFGLGTLPAMLATGWFGHRLKHGLQQPWLRFIIAFSLMALAAWLARQAILMLLNSHHHLPH